MRAILSFDFNPNTDKIHGGTFIERENTMEGISLRKPQAFVLS